jgi:hypothetical protein
MEKVMDQHDHLPQEARLEMLIGHLADALGPIRKTAEAFRLQSNASVVTRRRLEHLIDVTNHAWSILNDIRREYLTESEIIIKEQKSKNLSNAPL